MAKDYHSANLEYIKKVLNATYVAYEKVGSIYNIVIKAQGKKITLQLKGTPDDVTPAKYAQLLEKLITPKTDKNEQV
jgi:predicted transport protein